MTHKKTKKNKTTIKKGSVNLIAKRQISLSRPIRKGRINILAPDPLMINYPKDSFLYRGSNLKREQSVKGYKPIWFTNNFKYACKYVPKIDGALKIYKTIKPLTLINLVNIKLSDLSNETFKIGTIDISLKKLYRIILGKQIEKTKPDKPLLEQPNTQLYWFYKLTNELERGDKTLKWLNVVNSVKNRKVITDKNSFNRLSDGQLDFILLYALKNNFPFIDGYYAPHILSDWSIINCYLNNKIVDDFKDKQCVFYQFQEIALVDNDSIQLDETILGNKLCRVLNKPNPS